MDDYVAELLVVVIILSVVLVVGALILFWYCYRRYNVNLQQQVRDPHRPVVRTIYDNTYQSYAREHRQVGRVLPTSTRQQGAYRSGPLSGNYEYPYCRNVPEHRHVVPVNRAPPAQPSVFSGFSRGNYANDPYSTYGREGTQGATPANRDPPSQPRYNTAYYDYKNERRQDSYQSDSDSDSPDKIAQQAYEAKKLTGNEILRNIQSNLVENKELNPAISVGDCTTDLIIGVDATPHNIGGYFINLFQNRGEFYSFPVDKLPWTLTPTPEQNRAGNPAEFEMKNLIFALYLWTNELPQKGSSSKVIVFTDNFDYDKKRTEYGKRAYRFVRHLQNCERIQIEVRVKGTNEADIEDHAKFVKPADDFSRKRFKEGRDFLMDYFGLTRESLTGSHVTPVYGAHFKQSIKAREQLERVCRKMHYLEYDDFGVKVAVG